MPPLLSRRGAAEESTDSTQNLPEQESFFCAENIG
jgi:hypothetical protein